MVYNKLGKTEINVSLWGFGGIVVDQADAKTAAESVAFAVDNGVNIFDVAPSYGQAQYILGPALEPYRAKVTLTCKTGKRDATGAKEELLESLKALRTDYFDVYQFHALDDPSEIEQVFAPGGAMEIFQWAKQQGLIRHIGFTCHKDDAALTLMDKYDFDTMMMPINFAYMLNVGAGIKPIETAKQKGMGIFAIKALAHRRKNDDDPAEYPKCWYKPIYDNPELADAAVRYTTSRGIDAAMSPGDIRMFKLGLSILQKCDFKPTVSDDDIALLKREADLAGNLF